MRHDTAAATRREFILATGATAAAITVPQPVRGAPSPGALQEATEAPAITARTLAEAEQLAAIELTEQEREQALEDLEQQIDRFRRRRAHALANGDAPATVFDPLLGALHEPRPTARVRLSEGEPGALPLRDQDIAFAPVTALARWIETRALSAERLTRIYLERLKRLGPRLECVVTLTEDRALAQARAADRAIARGDYRGPLHGIPWGAKDLFDTAGIRTTWGATPYKDRVPSEDAVVVKRLDDAGAVLVAKLTLGALAYGDIWYGGRTNNPFDLEQGSSGSSAGPAAATAAGLVGFALGTETLGSIVSPCMRCGTTGLRPTFGRVARSGAMALCWSLDKIGPIARTVEDCAVVLAAINGADAGDPSSLDVPLEFDARRAVRGLRVGYAPAWFEGERVPDVDRRALEALRSSGVRLVEIELPDWPYGSLMTILLVEAAAAFEELTLSDRDDELVWQEPQAWPNSFRQTWFIPATEYVQAQRFRRQVAEMMARRFETLDALISPSYAGSLLLITNNTGHPSLTLRSGFDDRGRPRGITLWGRRFAEGTLCSIGMALERALGVWDRRPKF